MAYKAEDIMYHIQKIAIDPSHINNIEDASMFDLVNKTLQGGDFPDLTLQNKPHQQSGNAQLTKFDEHFKQFDDNTKQHNSQYKNKR